MTESIASLEPKKRRLGGSNPSNETSSSLESIVRDILWDSYLKKTPLTLGEFTSLVANKYGSRRKGGDPLDSQLLELVKRYAETRQDSKSQQYYLYVKEEAFSTDK